MKSGAELIKREPWFCYKAARRLSLDEPWWRPRFNTVLEHVPWRIPPGTRRHTHGGSSSAGTRSGHWVFEHQHFWWANIIWSDPPELKPWSGRIFKVSFLNEGQPEPSSSLKAACILAATCTQCAVFVPLSREVGWCPPHHQVRVCCTGCTEAAACSRTYSFEPMHDNSSFASLLWGWTGSCLSVVRLLGPQPRDTAGCGGNFLASPKATFYTAGAVAQDLQQTQP